MNTNLPRFTRTVTITAVAALSLGAFMLSGCANDKKEPTPVQNQPVATQQVEPATPAPAPAVEKPTDSTGSDDQTMTLAQTIYDINDMIIDFESDKVALEDKLETDTQNSLAQLSEKYQQIAHQIREYKIPDTLDPEVKEKAESMKENFVEGYEGYAKYYHNLFENKVPYPQMTDDHFSNVEKKGDYLVGRKDPVGMEAANHVGEAQHLMQELVDKVRGE